MTIRLDVVTDSRTARLVSVAKAARLGGLLPKESGTSLVNLSLSVREFTMAGETSLAQSMCHEIDKLIRSHDDAPLVAAVQRHTDGVRKALTPMERK